MHLERKICKLGAEKKPPNFMMLHMLLIVRAEKLRTQASLFTDFHKMKTENDGSPQSNRKSGSLQMLADCSEHFVLARSTVTHFVLIQKVIRF